jgi:hypothetical protein
MKKKEELLMNFDFLLIPTVEMLHQEIQSLCNFSFLKIVKLSLQTRFKVFFQKEIPLVPVKHHFTIFHFTNHGMNQSFPCTYGPIYHGTIFFYF